MSKLAKEIFGTLEIIVLLPLNIILLAIILFLKLINSKIFEPDETD